MPAIARTAARAAALLVCVATSWVAMARPPADPAVWGPYAHLAGTQQRAKTYIVRWHWAKPDAELVEEFILRGTEGLDYSNVITPGAAPGQLRLVSSYMNREWQGTLQSDGSVLWIGSGFLKMPYLVSLAGNGAIEMQRVKLRHGAIASVTPTSENTRFEPMPATHEPSPAPEAEAAQSKPTSTEATATVRAEPSSPATSVQTPQALAVAEIAAAKEAAPPAPALSDFDALLQDTAADMCASATERKSRFCDALGALVAKRQAAGVAIEMPEPVLARPGSKKKPTAAGKKGGAKDTAQATAERWGLLARAVDQPQFEFRTEPERKTPASPDNGYVSSWTVPGVELVQKGLTAGEEGAATEIYRWNAKRKHVIGLPLGPKDIYARVVSVGSEGITQILGLKPKDLKSRCVLQSLSDGGIQWTYQSFKDGAWTTTWKVFYVPATPEWIAQWQQWQARRREQARLAAEAEQQRLQAQWAEMQAQELARQQEEADADAEFEAERAQKAAAWNAMAAANEQGLADSIARLNDTTARVQAQQEQYRLQQQYAQQAAQAEQRQRDVENARLATQRQYEVARQFEAQQQAQREAQAQRQAQEQGLAQTQTRASGAPAAGGGTASTLTDANTCVSRPVVGPNNTCGKGTSASLTNQCPAPVDVRMCSMTPKGWDCSVRWGLQPGASWSQAWCAGTSQIFTSARNSQSSVPLDSP